MSSNQYPNPYQNTHNPYAQSPSHQQYPPRSTAQNHNSYRTDGFPPPPSYYEANAQPQVQQYVPKFRYADDSDPVYPLNSPQNKQQEHATVSPTNRPPENRSAPSLTPQQSTPSAPSALDTNPTPSASTQPTPTKPAAQVNPFDSLVRDLSSYLPAFLTGSATSSAHEEPTPTSTSTLNPQSSQPSVLPTPSHSHSHSHSNKPADTSPDINTFLQTGQIIVPIDDFECEICCEYTCLQFFQQEISTLGCFPGNLREFQDQCPAIQFTTCLHTYCLQCVRSHIESYVQYQLPQASIKRIPCPGCQEWITQNELRIIMPEAEYLSFEQRQFEWSLLNNKNMYKCITPNCSNVIEKTGRLAADEKSLEFNPKFVCQQCSKAQCIKCLVPWHMNQSCREYRQKELEREALEGSSALRNAKTLGTDNKAMFQECPHCKSIIEKVSGCDKVKCLCGYGFCWICGSPGATCNCTQGGHVFLDNVTGTGTRDIINQ